MATWGEGSEFQLAQSFLRFTALYVALFAAFGVASPFIPAFLAERGLGPGAIGVVLGLGSAVRLLAGPAGGRLADRTGRPRLVLAGLLAASAGVALGYLPARGAVLLALVSLLHAAVLAPLTPVADALALAEAGAGRFDYGWLRGSGSAAFIGASAASGALVGVYGLPVVIWLNAGLLFLASLSVAGVPAALERRADERTGAASWRDLLHVPGFLPLMGVVVLVGGSHAMHDSFEVIRWEAAGMSPGAAGALWGESVAAEVLVFFVLGRPLIARLGVGGAAGLSALAGVVRWSVTSFTAAVPAMAAVEPLHGFTFALLHLVAMQVIARNVPARLAATAQACYGTLALGAATTGLTFAAGPLYGALGARAFLPMAGLCVLALPFALRLRAQSAA